MKTINIGQFKAFILRCIVNDTGYNYDDIAIYEIFPYYSSNDGLNGYVVLNTDKNRDVNIDSVFYYNHFNIEYVRKINNKMILESKQMFLTKEYYLNNNNKMLRVEKLKEIFEND